MTNVGSGDQRYETFIKLHSYVDQSVVCVIPTRGAIDAQVVNAWFQLLTPVNHKFTRLFVSGGEVGDSYNTAIAGILAHPQLSRFKYVLSLEDDNLPPPDGLLRLLESMAAAEKKGEDLWAVSGLYWSKGKDGVPLAFGDTRRPEWNLDFVEHAQDAVTPCYLIPQGFTLYRTDLFRKLPYPWFKTVAEFDKSAPPLDQFMRYTQDSHFCRTCFGAGLRVGVRADVRVGHLDIETGQVW